MQTLNSVQQLLTDRKGRTTRAEVPTLSIGLDDEARLVASGTSLTLGPEATKVIAKLMGIPRNFYVHAGPKVQKLLFDCLFEDSVKDAIREGRLDPRMDLIIQDGCRCVGIMNSRLVCLSGEEVLAAVLSSKPDCIDDTCLEVPRFRLNGEVRISIISPSLRSEVRVGDVVCGGIDIRHSDYGTFATQIESFLFRQVCSNGMLMKICSHTDTVPSRLRRAASHHPDRTLAQIEAMSRFVWAEFGAKIEAVQLLAEERTDNAAALIRSVAESLRFPVSLVNDLLKALEEDENGPSGTLWDIVGAISRVGTHSERLSAATRRFLQELSGELVAERVQRCPTCGRLDLRRRRFLPRR